MSLFFKSPIDIEVRLDNEDSRQHVEVKNRKGRKEKLPLYEDGESVKGQVTIRLRNNNKLDHLGIKIQLIGTIETHSNSSSNNNASNSNNSNLTLNNNNDNFLYLLQELSAPATLNHPENYHFEFKNVEKQFESYRGLNVNLRYYLKCIVLRKNSSNIIREKELWVYNHQFPPDSPSSVKMDVGIEDCLHIEFEYSKSRYSLKDVIVGRIYFLLVRLKIKHMELSLIKRESIGTPPNQFSNSETLVRFEIMDGAPVRGEAIPIRLFLGGFDLTPTFRDVNKKFSVRTFLSLVLIDEDSRRYFKQSEIILYRE
ncbi:retromer subunit PEP8 [Ascoidea rubescens DSM 1968]|uniref:Vacuolar protein sorting-associated protein 26 n=1 Tax=Ascoidea rubescens DSM 1968 TaxID=1344418 RepID=A0A1D2V8P3_9ASCO|nr:vacuolar protein sorting-associated protein 26 [Ascoidea rubescens DSM 1968]ODV57969.1 vacuolar protein sorting-associated protein 26 [Ascoidea rubescens DSM 1968]